MAKRAVWVVETKNGVPAWNVGAGPAAFWSRDEAREWKQEQSNYGPTYRIRKYVPEEGKRG